MIGPDQAERQLVGDCLADRPPPAAKQLLDAHRVHGSRRMRVAPRRIPAAASASRHVDQILDPKPQPRQRPRPRRLERKSFDERPAGSGRDRGLFRHGLAPYLASLLQLADKLGVPGSEPS